MVHAAGAFAPPPVPQQIHHHQPQQQLFQPPQEAPALVPAPPPRTRSSMAAAAAAAAAPAPAAASLCVSDLVVTPVEQPAPAPEPPAVAEPSAKAPRKTTVAKDGNLGPAATFASLFHATTCMLGKHVRALLASRLFPRANCLAPVEARALMRQRGALRSLTACLPAAFTPVHSDGRQGRPAHCRCQQRPPHSEEAEGRVSLPGPLPLSRPPKRSAPSVTLVLVATESCLPAALKEFSPSNTAHNSFFFSVRTVGCQP